MTECSWLQPGAVVWWIPWTKAQVVRVEVVEVPAERGLTPLVHQPGSSLEFRVLTERLFRTRDVARRAAALDALTCD